jgi:hypothetical protein
MKDHGPARITRKDAVENEDMKVDIQVQTAEALHAEHRAALGPVDPVPLGPGAVGREGRLDEDARERRQRLRLEGGEPAKLIGQGKDVLSDGHLGQDPVHQVRRTVRHAPAAAARADAAAVAAKRDKQIVAAAGLRPDRC